MYKPKVIIFSTAYHPFIGGAEVAIQETVRRLKDRFDFYIITHRLQKSAPTYENLDGAEVFRLGFGTKLDQIFLFPFLAWWKGFSLTKSSNVPVVLWGVMVTYASIGALFLKWMRPQLPLVLTIQEGDSESHLKFGRGGQLGLWWLLMLKSADEVTAISTYLGDYAKKNGYGGFISVIPNGVDLDRFEAKQKVKDSAASKLLITTSRLVLKNGIDILISAVELAKNKIPDILCHIIGDGPLRTKLEMQVTSRGLEDSIKFLGSIPHNEVPAYLHRADIFVRPSRSEGMGNSFVEALAAGLPIIGTPVGGITDIIRDRKTGLFSRAEDYYDLADKIVTLAADNDLARSLVLEGQRMVREYFSWDIIANNYADVFNRALTRPLNIAIATPLMPPQLGGPALYADNLAHEFQKKGHKVRVANFGSYLKYPSFIRHFLYLLAVLKASWKSEVVLALDSFSVGLPAAMASRILGRPLVLRMEGDFLWEHFVERSRSDVTLEEFYSKKRSLSPKERIIKFITSAVLSASNQIAFSSKWRRNMVLSTFGVNPSKTTIIRNVWARPIADEFPRKNIILWAGRMLYLKNLYRLIRAFAKVNSGTYELHLVGDGPERKRLEELTVREGIGKVIFSPAVSHEELQKKIAQAALLVLPSLSDVGPNVIAEAAGLKTPIVLTQQSGYQEYLGTGAVLVDPLDENDLSNKLSCLIKDRTRSQLLLKLSDLNVPRDFSESARMWAELLLVLARGYRGL